MARGFTLSDLAERVGGRVVGDPDVRVVDVAPLDAAGPEDLSLFTHPRYRDAARRSGAGAILVRTGTELEGRVLLEVPDPQVALAEILDALYPRSQVPPGIHPDARVDGDVRVGADASVGPFAVVEAGSVLGDRAVVGAGCVVGRQCRIGDDTELRPRVVLYPGTRIGRRCLVHAGAVLGGDGFGFATTADGHRKVPQVGRVVVEDDVEIGANTTVDRACVGETVVGAGSKLDNLVMIAHGVRLGPGSLLAAQAGIAGSARLGERVTLAGQAGVAGHLEVGAGTVVAAKSAVLQDAPPKSFLAGIPAVDHRRWKRSQAAAARLPELRTALRRLEARIAALERLDRQED